MGFRILPLDTIKNYPVGKCAIAMEYPLMTTNDEGEELELSIRRASSCSYRPMATAAGETLVG